MDRSIQQTTLLAVWLLAIPATAHASIHSQDVFCHGTKLGTMEIDKYETHTAWMADVEIDGQFKATLPRDYHYVQSVNVDDQPPDYRDGTALSAPYIDTPPGGYWNDHWDWLVYYDQGEFPDFRDRPQMYLLDAKTEADNKLDLSFETWLVCVIKESFGLYPNEAWDDDYTVAPLKGWTWGFSITYADDGDGIDELTDFTVTKDDFRWQPSPSASWTAALDVMYYGTPPTDDWFNVTLGDCKDCYIPEPSAFVIWGAGVLVLISMRIRRFKKIKKRGHSTF